jgi:hypothetical protein
MVVEIEYGFSNTSATGSRFLAPESAPQDEAEGQGFEDHRAGSANDSDVVSTMFGIDDPAAVRRRNVARVR